MVQLIHTYNNLPRRSNKYSPTGLWIKPKSNHSQLINDYPYERPMYILDIWLQDGFRITSFNPRTGQGIYSGVSSLPISTVGLICNLNTNHKGPQFHCCYHDYFETGIYKEGTEQPRCDDIFLDSLSSSNTSDLEFKREHPDQFKFDWESAKDEKDSIYQRGTKTKEANLPQRSLKWILLHRGCQSENLKHHQTLEKVPNPLVNSTSARSYRWSEPLFKLFW